MREEPVKIRRRRVPVNCDDLKMALTWRSDELEYFLDLRSGEVRQYRLSGLTDGAEDFELSEDEATAGLAEGSLVGIERREAAIEYGWMAGCAAAVTNTLLRGRLEAARDGRRAVRGVQEVLADDPPE